MSDDNNDLNAMAAKVAERMRSWKETHDPEEDIVADTFIVSVAQQKKIDAWFADVQKRLITEGKATTDPWGGDDGDCVYYGAIGGGLTYTFHGTSLGTVLVVKESISGEEIDVTDYESW
jgi:hypothetical protein